MEVATDKQFNESLDHLSHQTSHYFVFNCHVCWQTHNHWWTQGSTIHAPIYTWVYQAKYIHAQWWSLDMTFGLHLMHANVHTHTHTRLHTHTHISLLLTELITTFNIHMDSSSKAWLAYLYIPYVLIYSMQNQHIIPLFCDQSAHSFILTYDA